MTAAEIVLALLRTNLVISAAILFAVIVRRPLRRHLGAQSAYETWSIVPVAVAASLVPVPPLFGAAPVDVADGGVLAWVSGGNLASGLLTLWLVGVAASIGLVIWGQARFFAEVKAGRAGPAAVGIFNARLVAPVDRKARFTRDEWRMVLAHEQAHIDRLDARYNALAVLFQCVNWFNPLLHLAVRIMRLDQEIACDATVMEQMSRQRRLYAQTLLRTQQAAVNSPLGCHWLARGVHPLEARIAMLLEKSPSPMRLEVGLALVMILVGLAFWAGLGHSLPDW